MRGSSGECSPINQNNMIFLAHVLLAVHLHVFYASGLYSPCFTLIITIIVLALSTVNIHSVYPALKFLRLY